MCGEICLANLTLQRQQTCLLGGHFMCSIFGKQEGCFSEASVFQVGSEGKIAHYVANTGKLSKEQKVL